MDTWEALNGMVLIETGKKRRSGKPHKILAMNVLVCMTEADAKAVAKKHPSLKFVKRTNNPQKAIGAFSEDSADASEREPSALRGARRAARTGRGTRRTKTTAARRT